MLECGTVWQDPLRKLEMEIYKWNFQVLKCCSMNSNKKKNRSVKTTQHRLGLWAAIFTSAVADVYAWLKHLSLICTSVGTVAGYRSSLYIDVPCGLVGIKLCGPRKRCFHPFLLLAHWKPSRNGGQISVHRGDDIVTCESGSQNFSGSLDGSRAELWLQ